MLDVETYLITKNSPGGPIVQMKQLPVDDLDGQPATIGVIIGRFVGLMVIIALGIYAHYAI